MEILLATVILSMTLIGLANIFVVGKRYIMHSRARMSGGELGRLFLDPLQMSVRQDTWNSAATNTLFGGTRYCDSDAAHPQQPGILCPPEADRTLGGIVYGARYDVVRNNPANNLNKVRVTVSWTEPQP